jgi:hypothetical protein
VFDRLLARTGSAVHSKKMRNASIVRVEGIACAARSSEGFEKFKRAPNEVLKFEPIESYLSEDREEGSTVNSLFVPNALCWVSAILCGYPPVNISDYHLALIKLGTNGAASRQLVIGDLRKSQC